MDNPALAVEYARANTRRFLEEVKELLRIPSVSALPERADDVRRAAVALAEGLTAKGMEHAEVIPTSGHPLVCADWLHAPDAPTVVLYGHYDVQPPDPLDEWVTPPFEPDERDGNLYARGATDNKGQLFTHIAALESLLSATGALPVNVRVLLEGEEEVGSPGIQAFLREQPERFACDVALVSDTEMFAPDLPTLTVGLRGISYVELEARGARSDLHSGAFGGAAPNPLQALARVIAGLKDEEDRVTIPSFYDAVATPGEAELAAWASLPFDEEQFRADHVGSPVLVGEPGFSVLHRIWARPTLEVHGIPGGFTGVGAKTVIPARAAAKISMRLVPDQDPDEILSRFKERVDALTPRGVSIAVKLLGAARAVVVSTENPYVAAGAEALQEVFGRPTVYARSGGGIPVVSAFQKSFGVPTVLMGFGLPDDGAHAPNEKLSIANFTRGIEAVIGFLHRAGR